MKHKVSELDGALLDAAVAKVEGWFVSGNGRLDDDENAWFDGRDPVYGVTQWRPSRDWDQGGPIIEREGMTIATGEFARKVGFQWWAGKDGGWRGFGQTPLIAAMRAYCASVFGEEVEL